MPEFFPFIPGNETSRAARQHAADSSPLLGRFRAVPRAKQPSWSHAASSLGRLSAGARGSVHVGYGALITERLAGGLDDDDDGEDDDDDDIYDSDDENGSARWARRWRRFTKWVEDLWVAPRQSAVRRVVDKWWSRGVLLVLLPAVLAVAWCAIPLPQKPLPDWDDDVDGDMPGSALNPGHRSPGHGEARVQVNFWFFLCVYYGFYNMTALIWITKVFNLYSLNWWPSKLGFPLTVSLIAIVSLAVPIPIYFIPETRFLTQHNTAWISWTFITMAMPVAIAFAILTWHERHLGLRHSLSETQRIFTTSWWTGEPDSISGRENRRRKGQHAAAAFDPDAALLHAAERVPPRSSMPALLQRRNWLPASFVRFVWFCLALIVGLSAYLLGEAYAEIYLRTLPHNSFETIVYVYSWVVTVHLLDLLTGWILGASEGERVGSYPLSWVFKLYFMLTYQTYVRALYARLRSPQQFIMLQVLSSSFLIVLTPLTMTQTWHRCLTFLGLTTQSYAAYQKICTRNVFIRSLAENVSMLTFLGSILVLHFGPNQDAYPYFAFDNLNGMYDFRLTFYASSVTWACELAASVVLRVLVRYCFGVNAELEGKMDLAVWPELLPTSIVVMLHVLQNMLFSIVRLHFY